MFLINYDFYDISACIICIRSEPLSHDNQAVIEKLCGILKEEQDHYEDNIIRRRLAELSFEDPDLWHWTQVNNFYTGNIEAVKDPVVYAVLSAGFRELEDAVCSGERDRIFDCADALHCMPEILLEKPKKYLRWSLKRTISYNIRNMRFKRSVDRIIAHYSKKWNHRFTDTVKLL